MRAARHIGEGLVDGDALDEGRVIVEHVDGGIAKPLIVLEMTTDENQVRAKLARPPAWHAAAYSKCLGFVRRREDDSTADGNGLATQRRVEQLLDRRIEGIEIRVEDGGCCFHPGPRGIS